jgi:hypothetical protein
MNDLDLLTIIKTHLAAAKPAPREEEKARIYGTVVTVTTYADGHKEKRVRDASGADVLFQFPPNNEKLDQQLERAQSAKLRVGVGYHFEDGKAIIDWVTVLEAPLPEPV